MNKHIGEIYEGRWKVTAVERYSKASGSYKVILTNIYNNEIRTLNDKTFSKLYKGETTLSKIINRKIWIKKKGRFIYDTTR